MGQLSMGCNIAGHFENQYYIQSNMMQRNRVTNRGTDFYNDLNYREYRTMSFIKNAISYLLPAIVTFIFSFSITGKVIGQENIVNDEVIVPTEVIELFNGKDLTGFFTWVVDHQYEDPNRVFSVVEQIDGAPAIRVSGENWGGLITEQSYADYHLIVEFRWGELTYGVRRERAMDSGILVHAQDPPGNSKDDFNGPWMLSIEYQLIEGGTGDVILVRGHTADGVFVMPEMKSTVARNYRGRYRFDPEGEVRTYEESTNRFFWSGRDPDWVDVKGFRGFQEVEHPAGEWNRAEIICKGDTVEFLLNGQVINGGFDSSLSEGKILFQSEGAEVYFRRIELHPLP